MDSQYPYLWTSLGLLGLALCCLYWLPRQRKVMLFAGGAGLLFGFFSFEFIPHYWDPQVVWHFITSPEDLVFSFATGVLAWALATWQFNGQLSVEFDLKQAALRAVLYALPGVVIAYSFGLTIMNHMPMETTFIGAGVVGPVFFYLQRKLWRVAAIGGLAFTLLYFAVLKTSFAVFPHFYSAWTPSAQLPFEFAGIPAYEILWALAYGAVFPLYLLLVMQIKVETKEPGTVALP